MNYQEKINKILNLHKLKYAAHILESKKEINMVMYVCWLNWEIKTLSKLKHNKEREEMIKDMKDLVNIIYNKYYLSTFKI